MRANDAALFAIFFFSWFMQIAYGEKTAAPAHKIDAKAIDQGVAYVLMLLGLLVTYVLH